MPSSFNHWLLDLSFPLTGSLAPVEVANVECPRRRGPADNNMPRAPRNLDPALPPEQAVFREKRNTCVQVLALTPYIESGFQKKLKTGAVLIDLRAACDTVWQAGLMMKLSKAIKCRTTTKLITSLISQRNFRVFLSNQVSRKLILKNGLPQWSVLAPSFFNVYISDLPPTESLKFGYADDWTLATQSKTFSHLESTLSRDIGHLNEYFDYWNLNAKKTVATYFHLDNKQAARKLKVTLGVDVLVYDFAPKYLGVILDRSITYRKHTENMRDQVKSRCSIISKLAGTDWGALCPVLRTSAFVLVYSVAEYCVPVWGRCAHVQHIDTQLNIAMSTVPGALRPTNINWLPVLSIFRRDRATLQVYKKAQQLTDRVPIKEILRDPPMPRLKSRWHFVGEAARVANLNQTEQETWEQSWIQGVPPGHDIVTNPTCPQPGFTLPRRQFVTLNHLRCGQARCAESLHRWGVIASPACPCGESHQTTRHIVEECPLTVFPGGKQRLQQAGPDAVEWLSRLSLKLWECSKRTTTTMSTAVIINPKSEMTFLS